jgi:cytochrome c biogenesis factor
VASDGIQLTAAELEAKMRVGGPRTVDDVSITLDGRRLDSKQAVLEWWAEVEVERAAGRSVDLDVESA